jgi:uncharacterized protein (TIRG00374 family)
MSARSTPWFRRPSIWIGLILSLISLIVLFSLIDFPGLIEWLRQADGWAVIAGFAAICVTPFIRGLRWWAILGSRVSYRQAFHAENIGYLINAVLPLRAGEPARAYIVSRGQPDVSPVEALSTVVIVRLSDMIAVLPPLALVVVALDVPELIKAGGYSVLALAGIALVMLVIGAYARAPLINLTRRILTRRILMRLLPSAHANRLVRWADDFLMGLAVLRSVRRLAWLGATTAALWAAYLVFYHLILAAFWPSPPLAWSALALCAGTLSIVIPSSPGYIGVFHVAIALAMTPYLTADRAAAYAIVLHATEMLCTVAFGIYGLAAMGTSLQRVQAAAGELAHATSDPND